MDAITPCSGGITPATVCSGWFWRRIARCHQATAALEFALVAPMVIALIVGTLQLIVVFIAQTTLQMVCEGSARIIMTGQAQTVFTGYMDPSGYVIPQSQFLTFACSKLSVTPFMTCDKLYTAVNSGTDFSAVQTLSPPICCSKGKMKFTYAYNPGGPGNIVVVQMYYMMPVISLFGFNITGVTAYGVDYARLSATSVVKTESY